MASVSGQAGIAQGFQGGLENVRQRRLQDQLLARQQKEDERRHGREDLQTEAAKFGLERARTSAGREDEQYDIGKQEYQKTIREEGIADFVNALSQGVDPKMAMDQFNQVGELQFADVQRSPDGRLMITDADGESMQFDSPSQFAAAMGVQIEQKPLTKLGKNDRLVDSTGKEVVSAAAGGPGDNLMKVGTALYDRSTGKWITPPGGKGGKDRYINVDKSLYDTETGEWMSPPGGTGGADGRSVSSFNPETTLQKIEQGIVRSHGGSFDALGNYALEGDREVVDVKMALAGESFARLQPYLMDSRIAYTQIEQAVIDAGKGISTDSELQRRGEVWRTKGRNKDPEAVEVWIQMQREKEMADARSKLVAKEQQMLARVGKGTPEQPAAQPAKVPAWAESEVPAEALGGATLEPGKEYDVRGEDGQTRVIAMGEDGRVYLKKGKPAKEARAPVNAEPQPQPHNRATEADTFTSDESPQASLSRARGGRGDPLKMVMRVADAIRNNSEVAEGDVRTLAGLDDKMLQQFGLNAEQISAIRALNVADQSLASLKRQPEAAPSY